MTTATIIQILWPLVCAVESSNNANAYNTAADAVGIAQITPIVVRQANKIVGWQRFTLEDRWSPERSYEIFATVVNDGLPKPRVVRARDWSISVVGPTLKDGALIWRCGADMKGKAGPGYWLLILKEIRDEHKGYGSKRGIR